MLGRCVFISLLILWTCCIEPSRGQDEEEYVNVSVVVNNEIVTYRIPASFISILGSLLLKILEVTPGNHTLNILQCDIMTDTVDFPCPDNATCFELAEDSGEYRCGCNETGFIYQNGSCVQSPCLKNGVNPCNTSQQCNTTSRECECAEGFVLNDGTCELNTPCYKHRCPLHSKCSVVNSTTYNCTCNGDGRYEKVGGGYDETLKCGDVDECDRDIDNCHENAFCNNTHGSFTCTCKEGYTGDGTTCEDVNECDLNVCSENANCKNEEGSYTCTCEDGYSGDDGGSGDGPDCEDVNECASDAHSCPVNSTCTNTNGSYNCTCNSGYSGDGSNCQDVDECADGTDSCSVNALCTNTIGSYTCPCNSGYSEEGSDCQDVDECEAGTDTSCSGNAWCSNTDGSYDCTCNPGYTGDGSDCQDIDECLIEDKCVAFCDNTDGDYTCYLIKEVVITVTVRRRKKRDLSSDFRTTLEEYFYNVLSVDVNITVDSTVGSTCTISIDAPRAYLTAIERLLADLPDQKFDSFEVESVTYPTTLSYSGTVDLTAADADAECAAIVLHISANLPAGVVINCMGNLDNSLVNFTIIVTDAPSDQDLGVILSSYSTTPTPQPAECNGCSETGSECKLLNGRPQCSCDIRSHDLNFTVPGTNCSNPIVQPVSCNYDRMVASMYTSYIYRIGLDPNTLHLLDSSCGGTIDGSLLVFNESVSTCGFVSALVNGEVSYTNNITNVDNGIVVAQPAVYFAISCSFPANFSTTDDENRPDVPQISLEASITIVNSASGSGNIKVTVSVYQDSAFQTPLTNGDIVEIGDNIYVRAVHSAPLDQVYLKLRRCWQTRTDDPDDEDRVVALITNSCPGKHVSDLKSGNATDASFTLKTVGQGSSAFYLHCDVTLCDQVCVETCPRQLDVSGLGKNINNWLRVGPISVAEKQVNDLTEQADAETSEEPASSSGAVVGAVVGVVVAVAVIALVAWRRRQNSRGWPKSSRSPDHATHYNTGYVNQSVLYDDCPSRISRRN